MVMVKKYKLLIWSKQSKAYIPINSWSQGWLKTTISDREQRKERGSFETIGCSPSVFISITCSSLDFITTSLLCDWLGCLEFPGETWSKLSINQNYHYQGDSWNIYRAQFYFKKKQCKENPAWPFPELWCLLWLARPPVSVESRCHFS